MKNPINPRLPRGLFPALACLLTAAAPLVAEDRPNILVIWGDDIGWENVSAYGVGVMGYTTPNIDSIGMQGIRFTDHYAQPSCTAGRASFITGQYPIRSGMTTVGQPGDALGLQAASPCLAEILKEVGYATGHFGKNHLGDRNEHLSTVHGFDEFYGNLHHLNTQEEAEQRDYQNFGKKFGPSFSINATKARPTPPMTNLLPAAPAFSGPAAPRRVALDQHPGDYRHTLTQ